MNKTMLIYIFIFLIALSAVTATVLRSNLDGRGVYDAVNLVNIYADRFHGLLNRSNVDGHYVDCPVDTFMIGENQTHRFCSGVNVSTLSVVRSLNSLTGNLNIVAGDNIVVTPTGSSISIASTASGSVQTYTPSESGGGGSYSLDENFTDGAGGWTGQDETLTGKLVIYNYGKTSNNYAHNSFTSPFNITLTMDLVNVSGGDLKLYYFSTSSATPGGAHWLLENENDTHMRLKHAGGSWSEIATIPKNSAPYVFNLGYTPSTNGTSMLVCWNGGTTCHSGGWNSDTWATSGTYFSITTATHPGNVNLTRVQLFGSEFDGGGSTDCSTNDGGFNNNRYIMPTWNDNTSRPTLGLYAGLHGFNCAHNRMEIYNGTGWV